MLCSTVQPQRAVVKPRKKQANKTSKLRTQAAKHTSEWVRSHTSMPQAEMKLTEQSTIFQQDLESRATPSPTVHYMPHQQSHDTSHALPASLDLPDSLDNDWLSELLTPQAEETKVLKPSEIPPYYTGNISGLQPADNFPRAQIPHTPNLMMSDTSLLCRAPAGSMQKTATENTRSLHQQTEPRDVTGVDLDSAFLKSVDLKTYVDNDSAVAQFESSLFHKELNAKKEFPPNIICTSGTFSTSDRIPEDYFEISSLDLASAIAIDGILARISKDLAAFTESKNKSALTSEQHTGPSSESMDTTRYTHTCVHASSASSALPCTDTIPTDHSTKCKHCSVQSTLCTSPASSCSSPRPASGQPGTPKSIIVQKRHMENIIGRNDPCSAEMVQSLAYQQMSEPTPSSGGELLVEVTSLCV